MLISLAVGPGGGDDRDVGEGRSVYYNISRGYGPTAILLF
jgi:hypothetical protein